MAELRGGSAGVRGAAVRPRGSGPWTRRHDRLATAGGPGADPGEAVPRSSPGTSTAAGRLVAGARAARSGAEPPATGRLGAGRSGAVRPGADPWGADPSGAGCPATGLQAGDPRTAGEWAMGRGDTGQRTRDAGDRLPGDPAVAVPRDVRASWVRPGDANPGAGPPDGIPAADPAQPATLRRVPTPRGRGDQGRRPDHGRVGPSGHRRGTPARDAHPGPPAPVFRRRDLAPRHPSGGACRGGRHAAAGDGRHGAGGADAGRQARAEPTDCAGRSRSGTGGRPGTPPALPVAGVLHDDT